MTTTPRVLPARPRGEGLVQKTYRRVHEKIAAGDIDPAQRISETELARMLGVSRTPLREALLRLRREGLLGGPARESADRELTRVDVEEIMEVRLLIEPYAAACAAERADPAGVARLDAVLQRELAAASMVSALKFSIANHDFRVAFLELAGNARLSESASRYDNQIQALRRRTLKSRDSRQIVITQHRRLVDAIQRGDGSEARSIMQNLLESARSTMLAMAEKKADARRSTRRKE